MKALILTLASASIFLCGTMRAADHRFDPTPAIPIELTGLRLTTSPEGVLVNWIITDTVGTLNYEVLRSIDGASWTTIHTLSSRRALVLLDESFTDPIPVEGYNAYRISAVKRDGRRVYSDIQRVYHLPNSANAIFPNPVRLDQPFNLLLRVPITSELDVEIVDDKGKRVDSFEKQPTGEVEQFQFVHHVRSPGNYAVTVYVDDLPVQTFPLQVR